MNSQKLENKNNLAYRQKFLPDTVDVKKVKAVLKFFGKAFFAMKIYPSENPSVKSSIDSFNEKIQEFLDEYGELIISVGEFNFSYKGEIVYQDEKKKNSLPFLFFKDGIRELSFYNGLDGQELLDFLGIVKEESGLPPEDGDIVNSLWVKDFSHIRYFAVDEFLESDTGKEEEETEFEIDKKEFSKGTINLTPEDKIELYKRSVALGLNLNNNQKKEEDNKNLENLTLPSQIAALSEGETPEIDSMLSECRTKSRLSALVDLLFEILFLEERHDQFSAALNVLNQCYKEVIHKSNFALASLLLNRIQELKEMFSSKSEEKAKLLEKILQEAKGKSSIVQLKKLLSDGGIEDFDAFFRYLKLLGPNTLFLVGDIWEYSKDPFLHLKASNFLQEMGQKDITSLVNIAKDNRASLTKEVIAILGRIGDKKVIPHLENFAGHQNKAIRLEIINSLEKIGDEASNKILLKFLSDKEREVSTRAATSLKHYGDKIILDDVIELAKKKDFRERNKTEKKILLKFLAMSQSAEVCALLRSILKKWSIFYKSKQNETRLCTIPALEAMTTPEAIKILNEGTKIRNKTIRQACTLSLRKKISKDEYNKILKGEQYA